MKVKRWHKIAVAITFTAFWIDFAANLAQLFGFPPIRL